MSFKEVCSPVVAITGPSNCVVYRDILLQKAHLCSCSLSRNCVGDAASGCGIVLTIIRHSSA